MFIELFLTLFLPVYAMTMALIRELYPDVPVRKVVLWPLHLFRMTTDGS